MLDDERSVQVADYYYQVTIKDAYFKTEIPLYLHLDEPLDFLTASGTILDEEKILRLIAAIKARRAKLPDHTGPEYHLQDAFACVVQLFYNRALTGVGPDRIQDFRQLGRLMALLAYIDAGSYWLLEQFKELVRGAHLPGEHEIPTLDDIKRIVRNENQLVISLCSDGFKSIQDRETIQDLWDMAYVNLKQAARMLNTHPRYMQEHKLTNDIDETGKRDPAKLNGIRGGKEWRFKPLPDVEQFGPVLTDYIASRKKGKTAR